MVSNRQELIGVASLKSLTRRGENPLKPVWVDIDGLKD